MTEPKIGVLALQGDVVEHVRALEESGARAVPVRRAQEIADVDGLVIPGGESTAMSKLIEAFDLRDTIQGVLDRGTPVWGTCAGMILLSDTILDGRPDQISFGAIDMTVRRNAFGRQVDSYETDIPVEGLDDPFHAVFIRAPWVEQVGDDVDVLARVVDPDTETDGGQPIVAVRQGNVLATSFHPEIGGDDRLHALFVDMVRDAQVAQGPQDAKDPQGPQDAQGSQGSQEDSAT